MRAARERLPIDGSGKSPLPTTALALIRAEKQERKKKMTEKKPIIELGYATSTFNLMVDEDFAKSWGRMSRPVITTDADYIYVTFKKSVTGSIGGAHQNQPNRWRFGWDVGPLQIGPTIPRWKTMQAELVEQTDEKLVLRLNRLHIKPPLQRAKPVRNKKAASPAAPLPDLKQLIWQINAAVQQTEGCTLKVVDNRLQAEVRVIYS